MGENLYNTDDELDASDIVAMLQYLEPQLKKIDPICAYFLRMCEQALLEAESKQQTQ